VRGVLALREMTLAPALVRVAALGLRLLLVVLCLVSQKHRYRSKKHRCAIAMVAKRLVSEVVVGGKTTWWSMLTWVL
jgi:hypothetical protein